MMNKQDLINLFNGLNTVGNLTGNKFGYAVSRNLGILKNPIKEVEDARQSLLNNYAEKDKEGNLKVEDGKYVFKNDKVQKEFENEYKNLMNENVEIVLHQITVNDIPKEATAQQINSIFSIIENNE